MFVSVIYRDHESNVTDIALFFDRADWVTSVSGLQKTYLLW